MIDNKLNKTELNIEELDMVNGGIVIPYYCDEHNTQMKDDIVIIIFDGVRPY